MKNFAKKRGCSELTSKRFRPETPGEYPDGSPGRFPDRTSKEFFEGTSAR